MAFAIANNPVTPTWKTDYSPLDRQENYNAILNLVGGFLPLTPEGKITFDAATLKATITASIPMSNGTLTYQWAASATEDGTYSNISDATSTNFTATSSQSEKYLGCKVTNTLNGVTNTALIKYGQLPAIS